MAPGLIAIGSGPAGIAAAETFRRRHPSIPVRILTADPALPYARPPLSKDFLCGRETELNLHTADWFARRDLDLVRGVSVAHVDPDRRYVVTSGGHRYPYWHLVLACGARPIPLRVPGAQAVLTLRSLADAITLRMTARFSHSAVVIGGGLIGCEAGACLATLGVATTVVAGEPVPLQRRFGTEAGQRVAKVLSDIGVRFVGPVTVGAVEGDGVRLTTGEFVEGELVLAATGVCPESGLAAAAGISTRAGRIVVDEHMHTSAPNVYAAGDVALARNLSAGRPLPVEHWDDATTQGAIAGASAAGCPAAWDAVPGFSCIIGDSTLKFRGWGNGFEHSRLDDHDGGFTVWYEARGEVVGVLSCNTDDDYALAGNLVRSHTPISG